jgi:hypothetical protein
MTSVVSSRPAADAAFCSARRVTQRLIEDALFQHVAVLAGARVVAIGASSTFTRSASRETRRSPQAVRVEDHHPVSKAALRVPGRPASVDWMMRR